MVRIVYYVRTSSLNCDDEEMDNLDNAISDRLADAVNSFKPNTSILTIGRNYYHDDHHCHGCTTLIHDPNNVVCPASCNRLVS